MSKDEAFKLFSEWYESCLENGIEPEEMVARMGGMALITNDELVDQQEQDGLINSY